jgi:anion-transporting  ArsA/GET3 family ATPase
VAHRPGSTAAFAAPARAPASSILARQLIFVTGKGGVGKTVVAGALALAGAAAGRDVTLCEVGGRTGLAEIFAGAWAPRDRPGPGHVSVVPLDPDAALREWIGRTAGRPAAALMGRSEVFHYLVAAAPGARELVTIGKAWDLAVRGGARGDGTGPLVIVDGPATGHALALLGAPSTYSAIVHGGPVGHQARDVRDFFRDAARSAVVLVATPEEMPVTETIELAAALERVTRRGPDRVVVNQVLPDRFEAAEVARVRRALARSDHPALRRAAAVVERAWTRARGQQEEIGRLRAALDPPLVTLPFLFVATLGPAQLRALARRLGTALDGP